MSIFKNITEKIGFQNIATKIELVFVVHCFPMF